MKRLVCLIVGIFLMTYPALAGSRLALIADPEFSSLAKILQKRLSAVSISDPSPQLCIFPEVLVLGPKSYLRVRKIHCQAQKRYVSGILYPSLFGLPSEKEIFIPILPPCKSLKKVLGRKKIVTIYSSYLEYYCRELSSCLEIRAFKVVDHYHLPEVFTKVKILTKKGYVFLILPDPVLLESRGYEALIKFLSKYHPSTLDLLGIREISTRRFSLPEAEYLEKIIQALGKGGKDVNHSKHLVFPFPNVLTLNSS